MNLLEMISRVIGEIASEEKDLPSSAIYLTGNIVSDLLLGRPQASHPSVHLICEGNYQLFLERLLKVKLSPS